MADHRINLEPLDTAPELTSTGSRWFEAEIEGLDVRALIHFAQDEQQRWVIDNVLVRGSRIRADDLRAVPVGEIERRVNAGVLPVSTDLSEDSGPYHRAIRELHELRKLHEQEPPVLRRFEGESAEEFYAQVAAAYAYFATVSRAPTKAIAETSEVPMTTARHWVREARRLKKLPPGRPGSVG